MTVEWSGEQTKAVIIAITVMLTLVIACLLLNADMERQAILKMGEKGLCARPGLIGAGSFTTIYYERCGGAAK